MTNSEILLNFIPFSSQPFTCTVYRKMIMGDPNAPRPFEGAYRTYFVLGDEKVQFWLSVTPIPGYEEYSFSSNENPSATQWLLKCTLVEAMRKQLSGYEIRERSGHFYTFDILIKQHPEGWQGIKCEIIWQPALRQHGILADFHFSRKDESVFSRRVQQLSLSLDEQGLSNRNYYRDKYDWFATFKKKCLSGFKMASKTFTEEITFNLTPVMLTPRYVHYREYEFSAMAHNVSQYWGIKKDGPYQKVVKKSDFYFVFRKEDIQSARFLFKCLSGAEFPDRFTGMTEFFKMGFDRSNIHHIEIEDFSASSFQSAADRITTDCKGNPVCLVVLDGSEDAYFAQKAIFLKSKLPSQDVTIDNLVSGKGFQWSVAGLALQLFCKTGGLPWRVQTIRKDSLIIGISQVWENPKTGHERYIAYSVTTDASGVFRSIKTLANNQVEGDYVLELANNLRLTLNEFANDNEIKRIVLHCSFRLKQCAMAAIRGVISEVSKQISMPELIVMRVHTEHPYFGYDVDKPVCVPDECAYVQISRNEYLIWCEGVRPGVAIAGRVSKPLRVKFDYPREILEKTEHELLQDLSNLAGANWRGFNAKARPVSVLYCELVGNFIRAFSERGLPLPKIEEFTPWFL